MFNVFKLIEDLWDRISYRKPSISQSIEHNESMQGNNFNNSIIEIKNNNGEVNSNTGAGNQILLKAANDISLNINICGNELLEEVNSLHKDIVITPSPRNFDALMRAAQSYHCAHITHRKETKQLLVQLLCSKFERRDEDSDDYTDAIQKTCEISFKDIQRIVVIVFCMCVVGKVDRCSLNGLKAAIEKLFKAVGSIDNQVVLRLEEKGLLITIVDKEFDISSLHELKDELGDTYNNIVQCICASGSLVRFRPTTVAFVLTRAFFSAFLNYNIDNVYLGDMRLKHIDLKVDSLLSNGEVAAKCLSE